MTFLKSAILPPVLGVLLASAPAFADDADFKSQLEGFVQQYNDAWNAKNVDGVMATYAPDGLLILADGHVLRGAEIRKRLEEAFSKGVQQPRVTLAEAHRIGDAAYAFGSYTQAIPGGSWKLDANWSATYVIENNKVLTKMMVASYPPPPAK